MNDHLTEREKRQGHSRSTVNPKAEIYSEPCQISKMEPFANFLNS